MFRLHGKVARNVTNQNYRKRRGSIAWSWPTGTVKWKSWRTCTLHANFSILPFPICISSRYQVTLTIQLKAAYSSETLVSTYKLQPTTPQDIKTQKTTTWTIHVTKHENLYKIGGNMNLTLTWCHWNYFKFNEGTSKRVSTVYLCNGQKGYWCFSGTQCRLQGTSSTL